MICLVGCVCGGGGGGDNEVIGRSYCMGKENIQTKGPCQGGEGMGCGMEAGGSKS